MKSSIPTTRVIAKPHNSNAEAPKSPIVEQPRKKPFRFTSLADRLADSLVCHLSWKWPEAARDFPNEPWLRCVKKYYPFAKGGPILIDEPVMEGDLIRCKRKQKILLARGYTYLIITKDTKEDEAREELARCRGPQS